ncbi:MAG: class IV adenylate cyclase [Anaerolineae bacterium]
MKNIEIKARCHDLDRARQTAGHLGAQPTATLHQVDTYFRVPAGRLKLREQEPGPDQLVFYRRPDQPAPKASDFQVVLVEDAAGLRRLLSDALGVLTQVSKQRELWQADNVRIHLDTVHGLGTFIEFEVMVIDDRSEESCHAQAEEMLQAFGIAEGDLIAGSYADLGD